MNLESSNVIVVKAAHELFSELCNVQNYEKLMPDNIAKFEVTSNESFLFQLKGMPEIKLKIIDKLEPNKIVLSSASDKVPFTLRVFINPIDEKSSSVNLDFQGEFNAMMAMMIKGPISKFMDTLVVNMSLL